MRIAQSLGTLCVVLVVSTSLTAQVTEVGAPQRAFSLVDVDLLGATLPTAEAMNSVGGNLGATLRLVGGAAVVGGARQVYDQGASNGAALAALGNSLVIVPPMRNYVPSRMHFDLGGPSREFGVEFSDGRGSVDVEFRLRGTLVASFTSASLLGSTTRHYQSAAVDFDAVDLRPTAGSTFVVSALYVEKCGYGRFGQGCVGSSGIPHLDATTLPILGQRFTVQCSGMPSSGGGFAIAYGFSKETYLGMTLPFDFGAIGANGCSLLTETAILFAVSHAQGIGSYSLDLPLDGRCLGMTVYNQAFVLDPTANGLGLVFTNGGLGVIGR